MKKVLIVSFLALGLSACVTTEPAQTPSTTQQAQQVEYTPEQYAKLAEAINKNKKQIIDHLNKGLNDKLQGTTYEVK